MTHIRTSYEFQWDGNRINSLNDCWPPFDEYAILKRHEWPVFFIKDHIQIGIYRGATIFGSFAGSFSGPKIIYSLSSGKSSTKSRSNLKTASTSGLEVFFSVNTMKAWKDTWYGPRVRITRKDKVYMTLSCVWLMRRNAILCQDHFRNHQSILLLLSLKTLWKRQKRKDPQLIYYHRKSLTHSLTNSLPITTI